MNRLHHKNCVYELKNYFFRNRLRIRLQHDLDLFNLPIQVFGRNYYQYILARIRRYGDCIDNDHLPYLNIVNNKIKLLPLARQYLLIRQP